MRAQHIDLFEDRSRSWSFLNLSNHPTQDWSEAQHLAVRGLCSKECEVVDVPFPHVNPELSESELIELVCDVLSSLRQKAEHGPRVIGAMVAGEPHVTIYLVDGLQKMGVPCYSATTTRTAIQDGDLKVSHFQFVRLREWPLLRLPNDMKMMFVDRER